MIWWMTMNCYSPVADGRLYRGAVGLECPNWVSAWFHFLRVQDNGKSWVTNFPDTRYHGNRQKPILPLLLRKNHVSGSNRPILLIFSDRLEYDSLRSGIKIMSKTGFSPLAEDRYHYILRVFFKKIMYTQKYRQYNSAQVFMNVFLP